MDVTILAFVIGGSLLSAAIAGGGFKEIEIPTLGWTARRLSWVLGVAFIGAALLLGLGRSEAKPMPSASAVAEGSEAAPAGTADATNLRDRHHQTRALAGE